LEKSGCKEYLVNTLGVMALLYYCMAKNVVEKLGEEEGKKLILKAMREFGSMRGEGIKRKVVAKSLELNLQNLHQNYDLPLHVALKMKSIKSTPYEFHSENYFCKFAEVWRELGKEAVSLGLLYCKQDAALMHSYNPNIGFNNPKNVLREDHCCEHIMRLTKGSPRGEKLHS